MQKLTLGIGFDGEKPTYELCVKDSYSLMGGPLELSVSTVMELSGMEMKNLSKIQKAVDTINEYSGNMENEDA
tara:strand:+ start:399 stop:617 length:219 start_codon:yes stop_codon:yes gene_type:complete